VISVISVIEKTPERTPKHTERSSKCRAVTPGAGLAFHRQAQLAIATLVPLLGASGGTLNSYVKGFILRIAAPNGLSKQVADRNRATPRTLPLKRKQGIRSGVDEAAMSCSGLYRGRRSPLNCYECPKPTGGDEKDGVCYNSWHWKLMWNA